MLRSKRDKTGHYLENSYNAPDSINAIRWAALETEDGAKTVRYYRGLLAIRKTHSLFRLSDSTDVLRCITLLPDIPQPLTVFRLENEQETILAAFNPGKAGMRLSLPAGLWQVLVQDDFADSDSLPIGRACDNCDTFLLTEEGTRASRTGEEGEIVVRGSFLADGYYNEPEKTAAVFTQNPLNIAFPERIYRTGDLARLNEKGEFIYISRKDFQIKRMGYRIELGEIEAAAGSIEKVKSAAALYDADTGRILVIYEGSIKDTDEVLQQTADKVPPYMRPDEVIRIKQMPYNANGKIDRQRLLKEYCGA